MAKAPFPIDPDLTGIAIAYRNTSASYIADFVAPYVPVNAEEFEWDEWNIEEFYTIPESLVGRLSAPNQITFSATNRTDSTQDYGYDGPIPQKDIDNGASRGYDPRRHMTEALTELIMLNREKRVADLVFNLNSYDSTLRTTLSGSSQFSDDTSDVISVILAALDLPLMRPTHMVLGQQGWTFLRTHPRIVKAIRGNDTGEGTVTRREVADLFELQDVWVGPGRLNTARLGQSPSYNRVWGKNLALITVNPLARAQGSQPTSFITARFGDRVGGSIPDPDIGLEGGVRVRVGEKVKELNVSKFCGYYFNNAFA